MEHLRIVGLHRGCFLASLGGLFNLHIVPHMINIVIIFPQNDTKRELRAFSIFRLDANGTSERLDNFLRNDKTQTYSSGVH